MKSEAQRFIDVRATYYRAQILGQRLIGVFGYRTADDGDPHILDHVVTLRFANLPDLSFQANHSLPFIFAGPLLEADPFGLWWHYLALDETRVCAGDGTVERLVLFVNSDTEETVGLELITRKHRIALVFNSDELPVITSDRDLTDADVLDRYETEVSDLTRIKIT